MLPLQSWWSQLSKRCCHYSRDDANQQSAVATTVVMKLRNVAITVVMKPTTKALLPLQSWWRQPAKRCCQNCRNTTAHRWYCEQSSSSMFIPISTVRQHSYTFFPLHGSVLALPSVTSHCVTARRYTSVTPVTSHSTHSEGSQTRAQSTYLRVCTCVTS